MASFPTLDGFDGSSIEMIEAGGEWFVRIVEHRKEAVTSYELEAFALAYAEGQRVRLGLAEIVRL